MPNEAPKHRWSFFRAGGVDQVSLRRGDDLIELKKLDQKLWGALAMPVRGVELDARTLALLDVDQDGRIRVPEIVGAVEWMCATLKNPDDLFKGGDSLPLSAIQDGPVLAGARRVLENLGRRDAVSISLADVLDTAKLFDAANFNGDGIVPPETAGSEERAQIVKDIMAAVGAANDRSGQPGIDQAKVDAFFAETEKYLEWFAKGESDPALLPLDITVAAFEALALVQAKIDDYFIRCRLAALEPRAAATIGGAEAQFTALAGLELTRSTPELRLLPLAAIAASRPLPLQSGINPAWLEEMAAFVARTV